MQVQFAWGSPRTEWKSKNAYASRSLTKAERQYNTIQKECFAIVYATKQFRHYLLGCHFTLFTDNAPLQFLSAQKMEGLLYRWALCLQNMTSLLCIRRVHKTRMQMHCHNLILKKLKNWSLVLQLTPFYNPHYSWHSLGRPK